MQRWPSDKQRKKIIINRARICGFLTLVSDARRIGGDRRQPGGNNSYRGLTKISLVITVNQTASNMRYKVSYRNSNFVIAVLSRGEKVTKESQKTQKPVNVFIVYLHDPENVFNREVGEHAEFNYLAIGNLTFR